MSPVVWELYITLIPATTSIPLTSPLCQNLKRPMSELAGICSLGHSVHCGHLRGCFHSRCAFLSTNMPWSWREKLSGSPQYPLQPFICKSVVKSCLNCTIHISTFTKINGPWFVALSDVFSCLLLFIGVAVKSVVWKWNALNFNNNYYHQAKCDNPYISE